MYSVYKQHIQYAITPRIRYSTAPRQEIKHRASNHIITEFPIANIIRDRVLRAIPNNRLGRPRAGANFVQLVDANLDRLRPLTGRHDAPGPPRVRRARVGVRVGRGVASGPLCACGGSVDVRPLGVHEDDDDGWVDSLFSKNVSCVLYSG